jgi:hypothetical protein
MAKKAKTSRNKILKRLPPLDVLQRYTIDQTSEYLKQCRAKTYRDIAAGVLPSIVDGRNRYVPGEAIAARSRAAA